MKYLSRVEFLFDSSYICIDAGREGMIPDVENSILTLGCVAGPETDVTNLFHEMGHFVDVPIGNVVKSRWGFKFGTPSPSFFGVDETMMKPLAVRREIAALAWQFMLSDHFGVPGKKESFIESLRFLPDFYLVDGDSDKDKYSYIKKEVRKFRKEINYSQFENIWHQRVALLPDLFAHERRNWKLVEHEPMRSKIVRTSSVNWFIRVDQYATDYVVVSLVSNDEFDYVKPYDFDNYSAAETFVRRVISFNEWTTN